jgi:glycosyltransferase involved in cell wall biosynthesis
MARALMLITGSVDRGKAADIAAGMYPRKDYFELSHSLNADILDHSDLPNGWLGRLLRRGLGPSALMAWQGFQRRRDYDLIYSDSEAIGIPLAMLLKLAQDAVPHIMIGHVLTPAKKVACFRWLKPQTHISAIICHASRQRQLAIERLGVSPDQLALLPYQVDERWWRPDAEADVAVDDLTADARPIISSAGLERRDYPTLLEAVDGLPARLVIAAASYWSKRRDETRERPLPENTEVVALNYAQLRRLYARSAFVVVPLYDVDFQAGITTILEAMAMGKAVIVSHSLGQEDVVRDRRGVTRGQEPRVVPAGFGRLFGRRDGYGPNGLYVEPGDPAAMRRAIAYLLENPAVAAELGTNGRQLASEVMSLDAYAERIGDLARRCLEAPRAGHAEPAVL